MQHLINTVVENSHLAPWAVFLLILLAGLNLPISVDLVIAIAAFLAATTIPEKTLDLFVSVWLGGYLSAMICYWVGRKLGLKLLKIRYFSKLLPQERLDKIERFYEKYGLLTLALGRFIPFGVRNCIFMTTGVSKANFQKFILRDAFACSLWASTCFFIFYRLGQNYEVLLSRIKTLNLFIFLAFGVTVIALLWYKKHRKRPKSQIDR